MATQGATAPVYVGALAKLLSGHILRDGEEIIMVLRPSPWAIVLMSLPVIGILAAGFVLSALLLPVRGSLCVRVWELLVLLGALRLMAATIQWSGCLYLLTNLRAVSVCGVLRTEVAECALRQVQEVKLTQGRLDRPIGLGTLRYHCQPGNDRVSWDRLAHAGEVRRQVEAAIRKAKGAASL